MFLYGYGIPYGSNGSNLFRKNNIYRNWDFWVFFQRSAPKIPLCFILRIGKGARIGLQDMTLIYFP